MVCGWCTTNWSASLSHSHSTVFEPARGVTLLLAFQAKAGGSQLPPELDRGFAAAHCHYWKGSCAVFVPACSYERQKTPPLVLRLSRVSSSSSSATTTTNPSDSCDSHRNRRPKQPPPPPPPSCFFEQLNSPHTFAIQLIDIEKFSASLCLVSTIPRPLHAWTTFSASCSTSSSR